MIASWLWGCLLGFGAALPWAVVPSPSTATAMRESPRRGIAAGVCGAGPRLVLDFAFMIFWFVLLGLLIVDRRSQTALFCISGAVLCLMGFRFISFGYTTRLWRIPSDPNPTAAPSLLLEDLAAIVRTPSFMMWWLLAAPGLMWLVRRMDQPVAALIGMGFGHALVWIAWSQFLVNATRHHKGLRILDGRAHRSLIAVGGLVLSLLGLYLFYFDVILGTILPAYVRNREVGWF